MSSPGTSKCRSSLGNVWTTIYDDRGQIQAQIDALGFRTSYLYNAAGSRIQLTDSLGQIIQWAYDAANQMTGASDPLGHQFTYVYDSSGRRITTVNPLDQRSTTLYDAAGNIVATVDSGSNRTTFNYDAARRQIAVQDARGNISTTLFDAMGRQVAHADALGNYKTFGYDAVGRGISTQDELGHFTTFLYNSIGLLQAITDSIGYRTTYTYSAVQSRIAEQDALGRLWTSDYDPAGRNVTTIDPIGNRTTTTFDVGDNAVEVQDARGNRITTLYNALRQSIASVNAWGNRTTWAYDGLGRRVARLDALGNRFTTVYDAASRPQAFIDPLANRMTYVYDLGGRRIAVQFADGTRVTTIYDAAGRTRSTQDARGVVTTHFYDAVKNITAVMDGRGSLRTLQYNALNQRVAQVDPLGNRVTTGYDAVGRQNLRQDSLGNPTTYLYDAKGRQTCVRYCDGTCITHSYGAVDQCINMQDPTGITTLGYDSLTRLVSVRDSASMILTYDYDLLGNRTVMIRPDGGQTTYSYDQSNNLSSLVNSFNERTTFLYDALNRVVTMLHGNGTAVAHQYNSNDSLTSLRHTKSDGTLLAGFTYSYDRVGNRTNVVEANGDRETWSYDAAAQLTREQRSGDTGYDLSYTYEPTRNRLTRTDGGSLTTYSYNAANQLVTAQQGTAITTYIYDSNGNLSVKNQAGVVTTHSWDLENQLIRIALPDGTRQTMTYAGDGQRRQRQDASGTTNFIWDGQKVIAEMDANGAIIAAYTLSEGLYGDLLSQRRGGASSFYHYNALNATVQLSDSNQATTDSYVITSFGEEKVLSGPTSTPYRCAGKIGFYCESVAGTMYLRGGYYDVPAGRLTSPEVSPEEAGHSYAYSGNSPSNRVDALDADIDRRRNPLPRKGIQAILSFDDAPRTGLPFDHPESTEEIRTELVNHGVRGAFFVIGENIDASSDAAGMVRKLINGGHLIGNHTYHHQKGFWPPANSQDKHLWVDELCDCHRTVLQQRFNYNMQHYRTPGLNWSAAVYPVVSAPGVLPGYVYLANLHNTVDRELASRVVELNDSFSPDGGPAGWTALAAYLAKSITGNRSPIWVMLHDQPSVEQGDRVLGAALVRKVFNWLKAEGMVPISPPPFPGVVGRCQEFAHHPEKKLPGEPGFGTRPSPS